MECFDRDERPCRKCGLWLEAKCPKNNTELNIDNNVFISRIQEIGNSEWSRKIF